MQTAFYSRFRPFLVPGVTSNWVICEELEVSFINYLAHMIPHNLLLLLLVLGRTMKNSGCSSSSSSSYSDTQSFGRCLCPEGL